ncbi:MAG: dinitrogenase iron-molybdenum cofactor biosynthesis protein [Chloroflexi bacterium]|jgi:predicted Fe-Mo cluster-binding NifX family protein|nr:dinitrogenase iron-molybdenum cofactor biosynthesis protein [Chloroflexota bacterium]
MQIVVSSSGNTLDAAVSPVFGRCAVFLFVDTETMEARAVPNPAMGASGGAGIQAAELVIREGAGAVLSGNLGPNAMRVIEGAGVPFYAVAGGTVRAAVEAFRAGTLAPQSGPTVPTDFGKGAPGGRGAGGGRGRRGA